MCGECVCLMGAWVCVVWEGVMNVWRVCIPYTSVCSCGTVPR